MAKRMNSILYDPSSDEEEPEEKKIIAANDLTQSQFEKKDSKARQKLKDFKHTANIKLNKINELYKEHQNQKNMRPEDKALMKQLIEDLNKERKEKLKNQKVINENANIKVKKQYKFGDVTKKLKADYDRKKKENAEKKERKRLIKEEEKKAKEMALDTASVTYEPILESKDLFGEDEDTQNNQMSVNSNMTESIS